MGGPRVRRVAARDRKEELVGGKRERVPSIFCPSRFLLTRRAHFSKFQSQCSRVRQGKKGRPYMYAPVGQPVLTRTFLQAHPIRKSNDIVHKRTRAPRGSSARARAHACCRTAASTAYSRRGLTLLSSPPPVTIPPFLSLDAHTNTHTIQHTILLAIRPSRSEDAAAASDDTVVHDSAASDASSSRSDPAPAAVLVRRSGDAQVGNGLMTHQPGGGGGTGTNGPNS
jgi:hypothetical protein